MFQQTYFIILYNLRYHFIQVTFKRVKKTIAYAIAINEIITYEWLRFTKSFIKSKLMRGTALNFFAIFTKSSLTHFYKYSSTKTCLKNSPSKLNSHLEVFCFY